MLLIPALLLISSCSPIVRSCKYDKEKRYYILRVWMPNEMRVIRVPSDTCLSRGTKIDF